MADKMRILKQGARLVVSIGVGAIVGNAVAFTTPVIGMGLLMKGAVGLGSLVVSSMVADKAADYTEEKIDEAVEEIKKGIKESESKEVIEE